MSTKINNNKNNNDWALSNQRKNDWNNLLAMIAKEGGQTKAFCHRCGTSNKMNLELTKEMDGIICVKCKREVKKVQ